MADKYDIRDQSGRKIGTAERRLSSFEEGQRAGEQLAGLAILLHLFGKPLLWGLAIFSLIATPVVLIGGIGSAIDEIKAAIQNPSLETRFREELTVTITQGTALLSSSLHARSPDPNLGHYFTGTGVQQITEGIDSLNSKGQTVDLTIQFGSIQSIRFLVYDMGNYHDTTKLSKVTHVCVTAQVQASVITASTTESQPEVKQWTTQRFALERAGGQWRIVEVKGLGVDVADRFWDYLTTYCH